MEIEWRAEDGFVNNGTQHCNVDDDSILDCDSVADAMDMIASEIQGDFEGKVSPAWDEDEVRIKVEKLFSDKLKGDDDDKPRDDE